MTRKGFDITIVQDAFLIAQKCNLIITATASEVPIIKAADIRPGTHITAVGTDSPKKIELEPALIAKSDIIVVDSKNQYLDHGEVAHAHKKGLIKENVLIELGTIIDDPLLGRSNPEQITIADLTGLAVQDIQILKSIVDFSKCKINND